MKKSDNPNGEDGKGRLTRRQLLKGGVAAGVGGALLSGTTGALIESAVAQAAPAGATLSDIEHIVVLMQENRSFDHYFGTLSYVRGFSDPSVLTQVVGGRQYPIWKQFGYKPGTGVDPHGFLEPFNLANNPPTKDGESTNDITHDWAPQHACWDGGAMDRFVATHISADGATNGPLTMGYFRRSELAFYYALADAFTICDGYFCSVLGPTDPNRVVSISASIDPAGEGGGPVLQTLTANRPENYGQFTWETMPERLLAAGVSWKVYNDPTALAVLSPFPYFKAYDDNLSVTGIELAARALVPTYPGDFVADVAAGSLPSVSWIMPPLAECEHPAAPPEYGEYLTAQVLSTLVSNPEVWAKTVLIVTYDENGGWFDHVPPSTAPTGTPGEYLTVDPLPAPASGIAGPIGLGFRVPCLVVSPYSAGGFYCPDTFDHTSTLRLIEQRFGVPVPNLSAWRRSVTGDMTATLQLARRPRTTVPALPATSLGDTKVFEEAVINALLGTADVGVPYPLPLHNSMPVQATTPKRRPTPT